ncbi:2Fe-2S iron-sulfur cluster binding domain-containing protein [Deferribacter autotrophicus]|uniref:2Fe-2S iron-sulfur cluster binding domain-containing protein n=1 Tax=Deferribacter autotrophicus TaxID=500465 RepID=A0A5A8F516_9BACT|nr:molybdopterin-dependent oxidoreductase [Deferribacter autotrophicus]KAA0259209.1 2Fe-2S iron-sulfur cluster binding domain-containing protein [Deferribacter autotrophicus]
MAQIFINDKPYEFKEGETILDIARRNDIYIPVMCYLKDITPTGACRLCLVQVEGIEKPVASCVTYATDGMKVYTDTEDVIKQRKRNLEFILIKHPLDCPVCDKAGECMLQDTTYEFGINEESIKSVKPNKPKFDWEMIIHDANLCVLCERCVKVCHEITGCSALKIKERGYNNLITTANDAGLQCDFCGLCVDFCPVGALLDKPYKHSVRNWDLEYVETTCNYCPVGCSVKYGKHENIIYKSSKVEDSYICSLGRYAYKYTEHEDRVKTPLIKADGELKEVEWTAAIDNIKTKLDEIVDRYGNDSIAFILGSRLSNEALVNYKVLADGLGVKKIVSDLSFYHPEFFNLYHKKFNSYEVVGRLDDIKDSDLIFVIGADLARESLGIKWKVMNAVIHNDSKLVTIGLKKYEYDYFTDASILADYGDFAKVFHDIINSDNKIYEDIRGYINKAKKISFIVGNEYLEAESQKESVFAFVDYVGEDKLKSFFYTFDKPNVVASFSLGVYGNYSADELIEDIDRGKVKCLIVADFYPFNTKGNYKRLRDLVGKVEYFVSIDLFKNDFNKGANVILPVLSHLESEGTFTTIDGRIVKYQKVIEPELDAKSDVEIAYLIGFAKGLQLESYPKAVWDNEIKGKNGYPDATYDEINGLLYKDKDYNVNKIEYTYKEQPKGTKEVYVNARYHNNYLSTKAAIEKKSDETYRRYYFDVDRSVVVGEDAKCNIPNCSLDKNIAKGIVLIPKN